MPRELITIQIGQCGNQIGRQFWQLALEEHAKNSKDGIFDESMSSFFRNVDSRYTDPIDLPFSNGTNKICCLKARAILVDMEEGPVAETMRGPLGELFDTKQFITDVSGSGNNWAHGHAVYGPQYRDTLCETIRRTAEFCDSLQSFFLMHSLGGGTGSGLGTYILSLLEDDYPDVYRFTTAIFPSEDDDVVTSPYNSLLSLNQLTEHADCVLPIENQALLDIFTKMQSPTNSSMNGIGLPGSSICDSRIPGIKTSSNSSHKKKNSSSSSGNAFDGLNNIVAHLLTSLTSSMRFEGTLNIDLNEITTNLVPYPKLHYLVSSLSPLFARSDPRHQPRHLDQMFTDAFHKDYQLIKTDPKSGTILACGLLLRGQVEISDINRNVQRIQSDLRMIHWNKEGFKVGICSVAPVRQPYSLLTLSNNCCIRNTFASIQERFMKLYRRKAHLHHYTEYIDIGQFEEALESIQYIIAEYETLNNSIKPIHSLSALRTSPLF